MSSEKDTLKNENNKNNRLNFSLQASETKSFDIKRMLGTPKEKKNTADNNKVPPKER